MADHAGGSGAAPAAGGGHGGAAGGGAAAGGGGGHGGGGGGSGPSAFPKLFAARTAANEASMIYYASAISALMGIFIIFHLTRLVAQKSGLSSKLSGISKPFLYVSRIFRSAFIRKVPALPSAGHASVVIIYFALNVITLFTNMDNSGMLKPHTNIASRAGWMAIGNTCLVVFLALKNTPLGYLTAWSYERLNVLHQMAGYMTVALVIIHGSAYASYFGQKGDYARLTTHEEIFGAVAGFGMLVLFIGGAIIRRWWYELFYVIHVSFFVATITFTGLHQPDISKKLLIATSLAGAMWCFDRLVRFVRVSLYSFNNSATLYPLANGGTKIVLKKAPIGASSGEHCFVWIPKARSMEMHPFTIAAMNPLEFVVASYDGFTRDLHSYAVKHPGAIVKASVEGSYGTFPDPTEYDKVILVAGGSGASFTFGQALSMLKRLKPGAVKEILFIWVVKEQTYLSWFSDHLITVRDGPNSRVKLYQTRSSSEMATTSEVKGITPFSSLAPLRPASSAASSSDEESNSPAGEKTAVDMPNRPPRVKTRGIQDPEKEILEEEIASPVTPIEMREVEGPQIHGIPIISERPNIPSLIREAVNETAADKRILVMGCGPQSLMNDVRNTTASCIRPKGPAVELHCEQFGW